MNTYKGRLLQIEKVPKNSDKPGVIGITFLLEHDQGYIETYSIRRPEETYGAISCGGEQIRTTQELCDWLDSSGPEVDVVLYHEEGHEFLTSALFSAVGAG